MRFPLMLGVVLLAAGGYFWGGSALFGALTLAYSGFAIFLAGRREEEAEAIIAEIRSQAAERGFDVPGDVDMRALVSRLRRARSSRGLLAQIFG